MNCPKCNHSLSPKIIVDECDNCHGMWFERGELRKSKDLVDADLNWMDFEIWKHSDKFRPTEDDVPCPKCSKQLVSLEYSDTGVEIDYCPTCKGVWLDQGEFKKIVDTLTEELLQKSFPEYIKASLEEAKEIFTGPESIQSEWKDFKNVIRFLQYRLLLGNPAVLDTVISVQRNPFK